MRTYNMSKRRQQERDHPLQLYPGIQGAGRLRGANGSQKHQQSLLALPTEARSHLEWKAQAIEGAAKAFPWKHRAILPEHGWLHRSKHFMITVSFIIPVANEEKRLEKTFTALQTVRVPHGIRLTEVIFVNDGSTDLTASMIKEFGKHNKRVRLISYTQNQGKGYAVRQGMLAATGDYALFFDADMSTSLSQIKKFVPYMENHTDVIIGTRKNGKSTVISRQPWYRELIGKCFTKLTQFLLQVDVTDFTCGFKAFSQRARLTIFPRSIINGWGFDAEILLLAKIMGFTIAEKAVAWTNDENTKVNLAKAIPQTLQELIRIHWIHIVKRYYFRPSKFPLLFDEVRQYQFGEFSPHFNPLPEEREKYHLLGGEQVEEFVFSIGVGDDRTEKVSVLSLEGKLAK